MKKIKEAPKGPCEIVPHPLGSVSFSSSFTHLSGGKL